MKHIDFEGLWERMLTEGRGSITTAQIRQETGASPEAVRAATANAVKKALLFTPTKGLFVPISPQYRSWGVTPADHFINAMMSHLGCGYYVGFVSAAAHWGAAHQAPQEYQVVVDRHVRNRDIGRVRLRFHQIARLDERESVRVAGTESMFTVATPEQCAVDLVEHPSWGGGLSNVATVLAELADLDGRKLASLATRRARPVAQRLGWLVEHVESDIDLGPLLAMAADARTCALDPHQPTQGDRNERWRILVNARVEADA